MRTQPWADEADLPPRRRRDTAQGGHFRIVLADEPTANLDSKTGEGLLELMREMNTQRGVTFIFSTHDSMVMEYARRVVIIKDGHINADQVKAA